MIDTMILWMVVGLLMIIIVTLSIWAILTALDKRIVPVPLIIYSFLLETMLIIRYLVKKKNPKKLWFICMATSAGIITVSLVEAIVTIVSLATIKHLWEYLYNCKELMTPIRISIQSTFLCYSMEWCVSWAVDRWHDLNYPGFSEWKEKLK